MNDCLCVAVEIVVVAEVVVAEVVVAEVVVALARNKAVVLCC